MNIAFCTSARQWGGVKTLFIEFGESLIELGNKVFFYAREGEFAEYCKKHSLYIQTTQFKHSYSLSTISFFYNEFKNNKIDIIIGNIGKDMSTAGIAGRLLGIPVVQTIGNPHDIPKRLSVRLRDMLIQPWYFSTCRYIEEGLLASTPYIKKEQAFYIDSGKKPVDELSSCRDKVLSFVTAGRVVEDKGHREIIDALQIIKNKGYSFVWHVYGEGDLLEELKKYTISLGLEKEIIWHGFTHSMMEVLKEHDIYLLPSKNEGLPNVLLEAYAVGLVVVSTAVGGIPEAFPETMKHFLVKKENIVTEFATIIEDILQMDRMRLQECKHIFWEHCKEKYNLIEQTKKFSAILESLQQKKSIKNSIG